MLLFFALHFNGTEARACHKPFYGERFRIGLYVERACFNYNKG